MPSLARLSKRFRATGTNGRWGTRSRLFAAFYEEVGSDYKVLLLHTELRWLSRGKVLNRLLQLREETAIFFEKEQNAKGVDMHNQLKSNDFLLKVAYLGDFFSEVNFLNLTVHGGRQWLHTTHDKVAAFKRKVELFKRLTEKGTTSMFPNLTILLQSDPNMKCNFTQEIVSHLNAINIAIDRYFPGIEERHNFFLWISQPFSVKENSIRDDDMAANIEFLQLHEDSSLKTDFTKDIGSFWDGIYEKYVILSKRAWIQFPSTYCCEVGFSAMVFMKKKYRNRLEIDDKMRCCVSYTQPRFERLIAKKQYQPFH